MGSLLLVVDVVVTTYSEIDGNCFKIASMGGSVTAPRPLILPFWVEKNRLDGGQKTIWPVMR